MLLTFGVVKVSAQYGCALPNSDCTEPWGPATGAYISGIYLPGKSEAPCNGIPIYVDLSVYYQRRCNEIRINSFAGFHPGGDVPPCYDAAADAAQYDIATAAIINRTINQLLATLFDDENKDNKGAVRCPSNSVSYSSSYASCFREVWTITWYTANPAGGPPIKHTHDIDLGKTNRFDANGNYTSYYHDAAYSYLIGQGVYPPSANITARYLPCNDYCCIKEFSYCYDENDVIVETFLNFHPASQTCPELDEQCYIKTCLNP